MIKEHIDVHYTADVIVDASYIRYSGSSGHLGHHPEVLGNFLNHPRFLEFLRDFKYWLRKIPLGQRNINVLVICREVQSEPSPVQRLHNILSRLSPSVRPITTFVTLVGNYRSRIIGAARHVEIIMLKSLRKSLPKRRSGGPCFELAAVFLRCRLRLLELVSKL